MTCVMNVASKTKILHFFDIFRRPLSTGLHSCVGSDRYLIHFLHDEEEYVITQWDLFVPKVGELKENIKYFGRKIATQLESVDYTVLIVSGIHQTQDLLTTVRLAASETPLSADKLKGGMNASKDEIYKKWAVIKEKLPAWQEDIAHKLQRLQDYINKKFNNSKKN